MPGKPRILCPSSEAILVNPLLALELRTTAFKPDNAGTTLTVDRAPNAADEAVFPPVSAQGWTNPLYFFSNDGTQDQLARATARGFVNTLTWPGPPLDDAVIVKDVRLVCNAYLNWQNEGAGGDPGDSFVRYVVALKGKAPDGTTVRGYRRVRIIDARNAAYRQAGQPMVAASEVSIVEDLRGSWGGRAWAFTAADLRGELTLMQIQVMPFEGLRSTVTSWWCGPVVLRIEYYDTPPDHLASVRVELSASLSPWSSYYDRWIPDHQENRTAFVIPPGVLVPGKKNYARVTHRDSPGGILSPVSDPAGFDVMPGATASLVTDPTIVPITLVEFEFPWWIEGSRWHLYDPGGHPNTYRALLGRRAHLPIETFFLKDVEIDGIAQGWQVLERSDDVEATPGSVCYDEATGYVYVRPPAALNPIGLGSSRSHGLGIVVVLPTANKAIVSGPTGDVPYVPIAVGVPAIGDSVSSFAEGSGRTPGGPIRLANVQMAGWELSQDAARGKSLWWRLQQLVNPVSDAVGLMTNRRNVSIKMLPPGAKYTEALLVFNGQVTFEGGSIDSKEVQFRVYGWELAAKEAQLGSRKVSRDQYPNCPESSIGKIYQHVFGAGHKRLEATVVDATANALLTAGENVSAVNAFYMDGAVYPETWTYDPAKREIKLTGPSAATHIAESHDWQLDGDGEKLVPWDGGPATATTRAGALFKRLLQEVGVEGTALLAAAFDRLDDPAYADEWPLALIEAPVRAVFNQPTSVLSAVRVLEDTRLVHVRRRPDGVVDAVRMFPQLADEHTVVLDRYDLLADVSFAGDAEAMAEQQIIEYLGYVDPHTPVNESVGRTYLVYPRWHVKGDARIVTMHAATAGLEEVRKAWGDRLRSPSIVAKAQVLAKASACPAGTPIVLRLAEGPDPTGELAWTLWKAERVELDLAGGATIALRFIRQLPLQNRFDDTIPIP